MTVTCELPEDWVLRIRDLLWKGLTISDSKFELQGRFIKAAGISVVLGNRSIIRAEDGFDDVASKILRILWKSGIPLEATMSRNFSAKELLPLLDKFEFVIMPALGNLIKKWGSEDVKLYTVTIIKDEDISLKFEIPKVHSYSARPKNMKSVLEFFRELYMWHPCDVSTTSSSNVESWEMPTFI